MNPADMTSEQFMAAFGDVCEHSPWIAEAAFEHIQSSEPNQDTAQALHDAFWHVITGAGEQRQLEFLRAHPELATTLADPGLAPDSLTEQQGAGLDRCSEEELIEFRRLNQAYREKFNFPFIIRVKWHDRASILEAFRKRIGNAPDEEFSNALEQVLQIIALRILDRLDD